MAILMSPSAVIFINNDLSDQVLGVLKTQLNIDQVMDGYYFDSIVAENPNFKIEVHNYRVRILVLRDIHSIPDREQADIILFAKAGLVSVNSNRWGRPGATLPIARVYLTDLINLDRYRHYWDEWCSAHAYERSWKHEPTNNGDFRRDKLDWLKIWLTREPPNL